MLKLALTLISTFVLTASVYAHSPGITFEEKVGDYLIEVGANSFELTEGDLIKFNLELFKADKSSPIDFTNVFVTLSKDEFTLFSSNIIQPALGHATFSYKFPKAGRYELNVSYERDTHSLVEKTIVIDIQKNGELNIPIKFLIILGSGLVLGFLAGWKFKRI